jgi:hypothetical protein
MPTLNTPVGLSQSPSTTACPLPAYDWMKQTRFETIVAGKHTFNSIQTFDRDGNPKDAQSDNND